MDIPNCYDPVFQEERHQNAVDRFVEHLPVCDCCFKSVYPEEVYYPFSVHKKRFIMCSNCKTDLDDSGVFFEKEGVLL